jgi:hypothetical protein
MSLITITHTIGCDALAIARRVADGLTVKIYDDSRLREEALRMGLHTGQLKGFREKAPDWFEHLLSDKPEMSLNLMESVIMDLRHSGLRVEMPEKGVATISGVLFNHEDKGRIPAVVGRIPGVERVQVDVMLLPAGYD